MKHLLKDLRCVDKPGPGGPGDFPTDHGMPWRRRAQGQPGDDRELYDLQRLFYATDRHALLLVFQAMDAAGKDSCIRHVMSGVNPRVARWSFKAPSPEELDHDFLWRHAKAIPEQGRIGIHNRSHYEEVLVVKVHPAACSGGGSRGAFHGRHRQAFTGVALPSIRDFEAHLARQGVIIMPPSCTWDVIATRETGGASWIVREAASRPTRPRTGQFSQGDALEEPGQTGTACGPAGHEVCRSRPVEGPSAASHALSSSCRNTGGEDDQWETRDAHGGLGSNRRCVNDWRCWTCGRRNAGSPTCR